MTTSGAISAAGNEHERPLVQFARAAPPSPPPSRPRRCRCPSGAAPTGFRWRGRARARLRWRGRLRRVRPAGAPFRNRHREVDEPRLVGNGPVGLGSVGARSGRGASSRGARPVAPRRRPSAPGDRRHCRQGREERPAVAAGHRRRSTAVERSSKIAAIGAAGLWTVTRTRWIFGEVAHQHIGDRAGRGLDQIVRPLVEGVHRGLHHLAVVQRIVERVAWSRPRRCRR